MLKKDFGRRGWSHPSLGCRPIRTRWMCVLRCRSEVLSTGPPGHRSTRLGPERLAVDPERSPLATSTTDDATPAAAGEPIVTTHPAPSRPRPGIKVPILKELAAALQLNGWTTFHGTLAASRCVLPADDVFGEVSESRAGRAGVRPAGGHDVRIGAAATRRHRLRAAARRSCTRRRGEGRAGMRG